MSTAMSFLENGEKFPLDQFGTSVRELRGLRRISVRALAVMIDRSPAFVSQVERGISRPTHKDIYAVAAALGVKPGYFFQEVSAVADNERGFVIRSKSHRRVEAEGVTTELLSPRMRDGVEFGRTTLRPLSSTQPQRFERDGYESGILLKGNIRLHVDDRVFDLRAEDSYAFELKKKHYSENLSDSEEAIIVWTVTAI